MVRLYGTLSQLRFGGNENNLTVQFIEKDGSYWTLFVPKKKSGALNLGVNRPSGAYETIKNWG